MLRPTKPQIKRRAEGRGVGQLNTIFPIMSPLMKSVFRALLVALLFVVKSAVAQVTITSPAVVGTSPFQITYTVNKPTSYQNWYSPNPVPTFSLVEGVGSVTSAGYVTPTGQTGFIRIRVQLPSYQYRVIQGGKGNGVRTITEPAWEGEFTIGIVKGLESMRLSSDPGLFSFVIPDGVKGMELQLWGWPGGAAGNDSMAYQQYAGGHGGYVRAVFSRPVVGSTVEIIVGQGGTSGNPSGNNNDSGGRSGAASLARMNGSLIAVAGGGAGAGNRKGFYSVNRVLPNTNPYDYWNGGYSVGGTPASSIRTTAPEAGGLQIGYGYQDGVSVNPTGISGDWIATGGSSYVSPLAVKSEFKRGTPYPYPFDVFGASGNNPGYSGDYVGRRTASSHGGFLVVFSYDDPSPNQTVTFSISGTAREWSGSPQAVSVTSNPIGVPLLVTYNGSTTAPTNAGTYAVMVTPTSTGYTGSASATLTIRARVSIDTAQSVGGMDAAGAGDILNPTAGTASGVSGLYLPGDVVPVSATLNPHWNFTGWTLVGPAGHGATLTGLATSLDNGVRVGTASVTARANFARQTYQLTVQSAPSVDGAATDPSGTITVNSGYTYTATASQATGDWYFLGWSLPVGTGNLISTNPTDANPTPPATLSITSNATLRATYLPKTPTTITFSSPGEAGSVSTLAVQHALAAVTNSGAAVSFALNGATAPTGLIASIAGSIATPTTVPSPSGRVNLRLTSPATRTFLAGQLDSHYFIADPTVGLAFSEESPVSMAFAGEVNAASSNLAPRRPDEYSEMQYLEVLKGWRQGFDETAETGGRTLTLDQQLAKMRLAMQDESDLRTSIASHLRESGVKTGYQLAHAAKLASTNPDTGTGDDGGGTTPPPPTYNYQSISAAPPPTSVGQTITTPEGTYKGYYNGNTKRLEWKKQ